MDEALELFDIKFADDEMTIKLNKVSAFSFEVKYRVMMLVKNTVTSKVVVDLTAIQFSSSHILSMVFDLLMYFQDNRNRSVEIILKLNKFTNLLYHTIKDFNKQNTIITAIG